LANIAKPGDPGLRISAARRPVQVPFEEIDDRFDRNGARRDPIADFHRLVGPKSNAGHAGSPLPLGSPVATKFTQ
jgi:hypothetical protein